MVGVGGVNHRIGVPRLGQFVKLETTGATSAVVVTAMSYGQDSAPALGGTVLIDALQLGPISIAPATDGTSDWTIPVPANATLAGASVYFQSLSPDVQHPGGFALSNGLAAQLCP